MTAPTFETLEFYRPWCRGCGTTTGPYVFAGETVLDDDWVQDVDDYGFPYCPACVERFREMSGMTTLEIVTKLPATACENDDHAFAGQCDEDCARTAAYMRDPGGGDSMIYGDYLGGESTVDRSGCHRPAPRPVEVVSLDTVNQAVIVRLVEED